MKKSIKLLAGVGIGLALASSPMDVSAGNNTYKVQRGDSLSAIASRMNLSIDELVRLNNIKNKNVIYPGQILKTSKTPKDSPKSNHPDIMRQITNKGSFPIEQKYYRISSEYGPRVHPITGKRSSFHYGIDLAGSGINRTNIYSVMSGVVLHAGNTNNGYGNYVLIEHDGFRTLYAHMAETPVVKKGQRVESGELIGLVGTTGNSTGPHLHLEMHTKGHRINPKPFLEAMKNGVTTSSSSSQPNNVGGEDSIIHTVKSGDTVNKIAAQYNITSQEIVSMNKLKSANLIIVGQRLIVGNKKQEKEPQKPVQPDSEITNKPDSVKQTTYTVQSGDSLWKISNKFNLTVGNLKKMNSLKSDVIFVGQTLKVNEVGNKQEESTNNTKPSSNATYKVQRGDNLWKIANNNGLSVKELKAKNNLSSDLIFVGQTLFV